MKKYKCVRPRIRNGKVWCPCCRQWLVPDAFGFDHSHRITGYDTYCRACRVGKGGNSKDYQLQYYQAHKAEKHAYYLAHRGAKVIRRGPGPKEEQLAGPHRLG